VVGAGEPVVLVHGLSGSTRWWARNVAALAKHSRVYLVDLPGFGAAHHGGIHFAVSEMSGWLRSWIEAVGIESASIIGHSMGGYISLELAARWPDAIRRLVLAAPAGVPYRSSVLGYTMPLLTAIRHLDPRFVPILLYDALRAGPTKLLHTTTELLGYDVREHARAVRAATLLICGAHDTLVPLSSGSVLAQLIPDAELLILRPAGHVVMFDAYEAFNTAVIRFLANGSGAPKRKVS
jgi:pimeloyl-ACP methyl ester carboxylesterase